MSDTDDSSKRVTRETLREAVYAKTPAGWDEMRVDNFTSQVFDALPATPAVSESADAAWEAHRPEMRDNNRSYESYSEWVHCACGVEPSNAESWYDHARPLIEAALSRSTPTPDAPELPPPNFSLMGSIQKGAKDRPPAPDATDGCTFPSCSYDDDCPCATPTPDATDAGSREAPELADLRESHRHIRRVGFPEHLPDAECYCDTCWSYLVQEAGGDPEGTAAHALAESWRGGMPLVPAWCIDHAETEVIWQRHHIPVVLAAAPSTPTEKRCNLGHVQEHWYQPAGGVCECGVVVVQQYHPEHIAEVIAARLGERP